MKAGEHVTPLFPDGTVSFQENDILEGRCLDYLGFSRDPGRAASLTV
jgi:hypothetical protein